MLHCNCPKPNLYGNGPTEGLMIIGEFPSKRDLVVGSNFTGPQAEVLRLSLPKEYSKFYATNTLCNHPKDRKKLNARQCIDRLTEEIKHVNPSKLLLLGDLTARALLNRKLVDVEGRWIEYNGIPTLCTYSPYVTFRSIELDRDFSATLEKLNKPKAEYPFRDVFHLINKTEDFIDIMNGFGDNLISLDIETMFHTNPKLGAIHSIGVNIKGQDVYIIKADLFTDEMWNCFKNRRFNSWNGQYEFDWIFEKSGIEINVEHDGFLHHYFQDERGGIESVTKGAGVHKLKTVVSKKYDIEPWDIDIEKLWKLPDSISLPYLCKDVEANWLGSDF